MAVAELSTSHDTSGFSEDFAGQGRIRWHSGIAHPVLSDIENCHIGRLGRNWLTKEREALANLALGPVNDSGLAWIDVHFTFKALSATAIVGGCCGGGFIISQFTPTVGIGCRGGGYLVFFSVAMALLIVELLVWISTPSTTSMPVWKEAANTLDAITSMRLKWLSIRIAVSYTSLLPWMDKSKTADRLQYYLSTLPKKRQWKVFFFRPLETFNITGTIVISAILATSLFYITVEWCQQSFMSTENYEDAMKRLRRTRQYKR
ncbi:hypothetical protein BKA63DRAFT_602596 [Paraphoma chrysanthemicola]|nr:hypothetical protein BKA63DRAFT_602596 [Paraphoma chrysanthemicola]